MNSHRNPKDPPFKAFLKIWEEKQVKKNIAEFRRGEGCEHCHLFEDKVTRKEEKSQFKLGPEKSDWVTSSGDL